MTESCEHGPIEPQVYGKCRCCGALYSERHVWRDIAIAAIEKGFDDFEVARRKSEASRNGD